MEMPLRNIRMATAWTGFWVTSSVTRPTIDPLVADGTMAWAVNGATVIASRDASTSSRFMG
jgi:hypothetical protein